MIDSVQEIYTVSKANMKGRLQVASLLEGTTLKLPS